MTTTYELYTNENGTPKAVEGKAPAIIERVEALETSVETLETNVEALEGTLDNGVVTSVNGNTGDITPEQTGCLPLAGGTVSGTIVVADATNMAMSKDSQNKYLRLCGGNTANNGAKIDLYGGSDSSLPGAFQITARTGNNLCTLAGKPDGAFTWDSKNIVRSVNGTNADASGNVAISVPSPKAYVTETWVSGTSWYRKWSDGWIEQGGMVTYSNDLYTNTVTFSVAFSNTNYTLTFGFESNVSGTNPMFIHVGNVSRSATGFVVWANSSYVKKSWYACGY